MSVTITKATTALLESVVAKLKVSIGSNSSLGYLQNRYIEHGVDERVAPGAADKSISVYLSTLGRESLGPIRKETYQVIVAFTSRKKGLPSDMRGTTLATDIFNPNLVSIQEVVEGIVESIDGKLDIITAANDLLNNNYDKFVTMPLFLTPNSDLKPQEVGTEHFYIQPSKSGLGRSVETLEGYLVEIPFIGATRFIDTTGE